jgi:polysaccharide pyruvyl transferase CsaB
MSQAPPLDASTIDETRAPAAPAPPAFRPPVPRALVLAGWYGLDNIGDEALLRQFLHEIPPSDRLHLTVLAHNRNRIHAQYGGENVTALQHVRLTDLPGLKYLLRGHARPLFDALRQADALVVGGGSLIHDNSGLRSLLPVIDDIFLAKRFGRQVWLYAVGIGPLRGPLARRLAARALRRCDVITVRDSDSVALLEELGVKRQRVFLVQDPIFRFVGQPPVPRLLAQLPTGAIDADSVGVFLKTAFGGSRAESARMVSWLAAEFDALHRSHGLRFVLLPMMTHPEDDDRVIARQVRAAMACPEAATAIGTMVDPEEMMGLAGQFRLNIAMRLHGTIFSLAQAVPSVAIGYHPKVDALMRELGLGDFLVGMRPPQDGALVRAVGAALEGEAALRTALAARLPALRAEAGRFFDMLRAALCAGGPMSCPS